MGNFSNFFVEIFIKFVGSILHLAKLCSQVLNRGCSFCIDFVSVQGENKACKTENNYKLKFRKR